VLCSIVGLFFLLLKAIPVGDAKLTVGVSIFGFAMVLLYTSSTFYHALTNQRAKLVFQLMDHGSIYVLIAGTGTPFSLTVLQGPWGWSMLGVMWGLAILGILYEVVWRRPWKKLSLVFYLALGWVVVIAAKPLVEALPTNGLILIALGGACYTGGAVFYSWRLFPYHHAVWHLFVLGGTAFHWVCIYKYVIPG